MAMYYYEWEVGVDWATSRLGPPRGRLEIKLILTISINCHIRNLMKTNVKIEKPLILGAGQAQSHIKSDTLCGQNNI